MAQPMEVEGAAGAAAGAADERAKGDWIDAEPESQSKERSPFTELSEWRYLLRQPAPLVPAEEKAAVRARLMARVEKDSMAAYYRFVAADAAAGVQLDEELARRMEERNAAELAALEAAIEKAKKESGSTEVRDAYMARSDFLARTAAREVAAKSYEETLGRTVGSGAKVDVEFAVVRLGMLYADLALVRKHLDAAGELVESGADWEQRNLFKVYRATYLMTVRSFREASRLMLDSLATFTCTELYDYTTFVFYAAVVATASVDRTTLRDKVLSSAEVLSSYHEIPHLQAFLESLHRCRYAEFLRALQELVPRIRRDQYMGPHFPFLLREIRVVLYRQYLQAYRSVRLASMAETFGLSVDFVDRELSRFIAAGRLSCKIDKVNGVVESVRPDSKNSQYLDTIKQGDLLLNRIQKLTKLTNV